MKDSTSHEKNEKASGDRPFEKFLEAVPDAVVAVDRTGSIVAVNAQAESLFGYSRADLIGRKMEMLVPERFRGTHVGHRDGYMAHPKTRPMGMGMDLVGRHKSGAEIPVEISLNPVETPEGPLVLAAVRDVTDRRQAREALKVAQAKLELTVAERTAELLAANKSLRQEIGERGRLEKEVLGISEREQQRIGQDLHDNLGQTLTAVTYIAQLMHKRLAAGEAADPKDAAEILKLVSGAIDQVRGLARGLYPVELKANGLVPALQELAAATEAKWRLPCEVRHDDPDPVKDPAAAIQLYRIAQEAVANAAKHAKAKRVTVRLASSNGTVELSVEDDGQGLPERQNDRGMGMHIMRYRADLIGATFDLRKRAEGGTTVVCVWRKGG
jgi:two-component system, LuxR family, sensor kinase FixL